MAGKTLVMPTLEYLRGQFVQEMQSVGIVIEAHGDTSDRYLEIGPNLVNEPPDKELGITDME